MKMNCPKCDQDISESYEPDDHSVGIVGGWFCADCDLGVGEHEVSREPLDGDVPMMIAKELRGDKLLGTPLSELRGRAEYPGDPGYDEFCRIAKSWGFE